MSIFDSLERIGTVDWCGACRMYLLNVLRVVLEEAEAWSRAEGGDAGARAVEDLREALERDMIAM